MFSKIIEPSLASGQRVVDFEGVLAAMPEALVGVDRDGVIRFVNRNAEALFGYDRNALVGRLIEVLVPESFRTIHQALRAGYVADPTTRVFGTDLGLTGRKGDGTEFPADIRLSHVGTGDSLIVLASVRDMTATEQRQAFEGAQWMAAIVENSDDAIIGATLEGVITSWNPAAERMYGYWSQEIIGKSAAILSPPGQATEMHASLASIRAGRTVERFETIRVRKDKTAITVAMAVSPIRMSGGAIVGSATISRDLTEREQAAHYARSLIEAALDPLVTISPVGKITDVNEATVKATGIPRDQLVGTPFSDYFTAPDQAKEGYLKVFAQGAVTDYPLTLRHLDGTLTDVLYNASVYRDVAGKVLGVFAAARDVTAQKQAALSARSLAAAETMVRTVIASGPIGIALADLDGSIRVVNSSLCDLLGYGEEFFVSHRLQDFVHPDDVEKALAYRARVIAGSGDKIAMKMRLVRADGATVWARRAYVLISGKDGQPDMLMVHSEDISAEHDAHEALTFQAFHDPMTGLHNRAWVLDILGVDLRAAKGLGNSVGALFIDLDNVKVVNDSLGYAAADEVLVIVADRIAAVLREGDRLGRFFGGEFVIVVQDVRDPRELERFAKKVSASIATDLLVRGHRIIPTASIGIAMSTSASTPESLLGDADLALSRAKVAGRARYQFFDEAMHDQAVARLMVEDQLRDAITRGEFVVHYQPIVALADARIVGHEALVRWSHPRRGLLTPGDFLDVAEDTGLIMAIGGQVLDQVCTLLAERPDLPGPISVNVSAVQLAAPEWLISFTDTLTRHQVDPARIVIEVTETAALSLSDSDLSALTSLRGLGVGIHLDDFGTGYSSISVLRELPVTGVKLDLRFVHDLTTEDSQANALALGVSGLVHAMHLTGIAEGIEIKIQADILRAQGWQCGQGYYFGKPTAMPVTN